MLTQIQKLAAKNAAVSIPLFSGLHADVTVLENSLYPGVSIPLFSGLHADLAAIALAGARIVSIPLFSGLHAD